MRRLLLKSERLWRDIRGCSAESESRTGEYEGENPGDERRDALRFGGGVVEDGREVDGLEERGEWLGDEGPDELISAAIEDGIGTLYVPFVWLGADESSTSFRSDCKKVGWEEIW